MNPGVIYTVLKLKNDVEYIHPENLAVVAEEDNLTRPPLTYGF